MGKAGLLDLENHFVFHGTYHKNPINVLMHTLFVWPIIFSTLVVLNFVPPLFSISHTGFIPSGFLDQGLVLNLGFFLTIIHALTFICLDKKAGSLAALLFLACWVGASSLAARLGFSLAWKVVLPAQLFCGTGLFLGHGVFEKRVSTRLDNFIQALVMEPFFVVLEVLQTCCGYEPYPGFHASVKARIEAELKEFEDRKQKKIS
ncbi:hypothetical protein HS088_TW20G00534 [Tripterygium wilfordii]|uniref:Uncharacterized protein n=1 Tax=Tripterygium wilfordii TaxID=458696 RepID=A0A7J7C7Q4_TRIWF|nr:2-hydroxy-palmitic acid dioxygenase MPO1-like [Tripterygium wilfordii]KAF5730163.1 hypothetical protein HS088_TW20G00534 [Tripterygium wilfordii]